VNDMKTTRRKFIATTTKAGLATLVGAPALLESAAACSPAIAPVSSATALTFSQIALPYAYHALEPYIDAQTMEIHYTKHHAAYVKNANDAVIAENITVSTEADFFTSVSKLSAKARNNGGGVWNHNFFWQVMKPQGGGAPTGKVSDAINASFGSFEKFKELFTQAAMTRFGSGWAWLVIQNSKLQIGSTSNQDNPLMDLPYGQSQAGMPAGQAGAGELKGTPLLALDVWEHAYYLKYQNKRNEYVANWWNVVNWEEVAKRLV
jgi:Fe-Mn family superoxide dismutase